MSAGVGLADGLACRAPVGITITPSPGLTRNNLSLAASSINCGFFACATLFLRSLFSFFCFSSSSLTLLTKLRFCHSVYVEWTRLLMIKRDAIMIIKKTIFFIGIIGYNIDPFLGHCKGSLIRVLDYLQFS